jgi:hypothetical protein
VALLGLGEEVEAADAKELGGRRAANAGEAAAVVADDVRGNGDRDSADLTLSPPRLLLGVVSGRRTVGLPA